VSEIVELLRRETAVIERPGGGETVVVVQSPALEIVEVAEQGPPGPSGQSGGSALTAMAGAALGGHRLVVFDAEARAQYASANNPAHFGAVVGLTLGAAVAGSPVDIQRVGEVVEPSWSWSSGLPVYLGVDGLLTQTPPVAPSFCLIVGFPVTATRLFVSLREPLKLI